MWSDKTKVVKVKKAALCTVVGRGMHRGLAAAGATSSCTPQNPQRIK